MTDLIDNYEDKTPSQLENEISDADFSQDELEELRDHEVLNGEDRAMVLNTIDAELAALEAEQAEATGAEQADAADAEQANAADTATDASTEEVAAEDVEFVDVKSDGHHYAGGYFFDEVQGEKREGVRYNARVKEAEEKGRLKVLD